MTTISIKDGNNTDKTLTLPTLTGNGNPGVAIVEPLPAGNNPIGTVNLGTIGLAATATKQDAGNATLTQIEVDTSAIATAIANLATQATLAAMNGKIPSNPATDRTAANAPFSVRLTDGSNFLSALPVSQNGTWAFSQTANTSTTAITPTRGIKTVASAGAPEPLTASPTLVQKVSLIPQKAPRTANAGTVWVDFTSGNDSQAIALSIDTSVALAVPSIMFEAPTGKKIDLNAIVVDVAVDGDGVYYLGFD